MRVFEFPCDEVKKDSSVIIYGGGDVGRQYVSQINAHGYAKILFVVDSQSYPLNGLMHGVRTVSSYYFYENIDKYQCDHLIIAIADDNERKRISEELVSKGVSKDKLVTTISYYDSVRSLKDGDLRQWFRPSFSWYGEDLVVKGLFRMIGIEQPGYLDVGCNHPYEGNNTAFLYLTGSHGVNIDASQGCIDLMNRERPDDINACIGVAVGGGEKTFYMLDETNALNSFSDDYINNYYESQHLDGSSSKGIKRIVQCYTLDEVIEKYCNGLFPDYFDLDIEGYDSEVIKHYSFSKTRPKVICVESNEEEMNKYLESKGYKLYFSTPHNEIFIDSDVFR